MNLDKFKAKVEGFITKKGMKATEFGRVYASDPSFVFELRKGREPREATRAKIIDAMSDASSPEQSA